MSAIVAFLTNLINQLIDFLKKLPTERPVSLPGSAKDAAKETISRVPVYGNKSPDVVIIQKALGIEADGDFGPKTKAAISSLQKKNGLAGSGVIGPKTLALLNIEVVASLPSTGQKTTTKDLVGKKGRHLHPELRVLMEERAFPMGKVPDFFISRDLPKVVVYLAKVLLSLNIREVGGNNKGEKVSWLQAVIGVFKKGGTGDAWCMSFVQSLVAFIEDYYEVESPVLDSEHCVSVYLDARKILGLTTPKCTIGSIYIGRHGSSERGHTVIVTEILPGNKFKNIGGNTGGGSLSDGDGAFEKNYDLVKNGDLITQGFVYVYPNNVIPEARELA